MCGNKKIAMSVSTMLEAPLRALNELGLPLSQQAHYQLTSSQLAKAALQRGEAFLNDTGALVISTGTFTGRSPADKFTVKDEVTAGKVNWNDFNIPIEEKYFFQLKQKNLK